MRAAAASLKLNRPESEGDCDALSLVAGGVVCCSAMQLCSFEPYEVRAMNMAVFVW